MPNLVTFLWFDSQAEEAAEFYCTVFKNSRVRNISRYTEAGKEVHRREPGSAMTVEFEIDGKPFVALNGGPVFKFTEAISFQIPCETQDDVDYYWSALTDGGEESQCGWLKDKFGLSWQVVPTVLGKMLSGSNPEGAKRVTNAFMQMKKFDIAALERAYEG